MKLKNMINVIYLIKIVKTIDVVGSKDQNETKDNNRQKPKMDYRYQIKQQQLPILNNQPPPVDQQFTGEWKKALFGRGGILTG
jgi:hypothetical protein